MGERVIKLGFVAGFYYVGEFNSEKYSLDDCLAFAFSEEPLRENQVSNKPNIVVHLVNPIPFDLFRVQFLGSYRPSISMDKFVFVVNMEDIDPINSSNLKKYYFESIETDDIIDEKVQKLKERTGWK